MVGGSYRGKREELWKKKKKKRRRVDLSKGKKNKGNG